MHHPLERFPFANFNNFRALGQVHQLQGFDIPINAISTMILIPVRENTNFQNCKQTAEMGLLSLDGFSFGS